MEKKVRGSIHSSNGQGQMLFGNLALINFETFGVFTTYYTKPRHELRQELGLLSREELILIRDAINQLFEKEAYAIEGKNPKVSPAQSSV